MWLKRKALGTTRLLLCSSCSFCQSSMWYSQVITFFAQSLWYSQAMNSGSQFLSWPFPLVLFWYSSLREIIFLVFSSCKRAFKAFEKIQCTKEIIATVINRIIPNIFSALWSHGPQDSNQSKSKKSKKDSAEGVTILSQVDCSVILCNWVSTSSEVLIQVQ